jgi:hypothetical protein
MRKRLLCIGVVVLLASSTASAGTWDWLWDFVWGFGTPHSQVQGVNVMAGNIVSNQGTGTTSNTQGGTFGRTQISPWGVQSSTVTVNQSGAVTGYSPGSLGVASAQTQVTTYQGQRY